MDSKFKNWKAMVFAGLTAAVALPLAVGANAALDSGSFTVKSVNSKDSSIVAYAGVEPRTGGGDTTGPGGGGENPDPEDDSILKTFSCASEQVVITQDMQNLSDSNKKLRDSGRSSEMIADPAGGWKIMEDISNFYGGEHSGVVFTKDDYWGGTADSAHRSDGWAIVDTQESACKLTKVIEGKIHSENSPAEITVTNGKLSEGWYLNNNWGRNEHSPIEIQYYGGDNSSQIALEGWKEDPTKNDWVISTRQFNEDGSTSLLRFLKLSDNGSYKSATNPRDWPGEEINQDLWDHYWNGGY